MLYGNIIIINKKGQDGSKYPVTEKSIKIGRSEQCVIRIYNNQVALEHCQLIIGDDGQATLKDLSNQTVLNGNLLAHGEVTLCHGDIFKVGERLARWEYLPTSKYYGQLLPSMEPTVRLVAVVQPQQRSLDDLSASGLVTSSLKNTPVGQKTSHSERFLSENAPLVKRSKYSDFDLVKMTNDSSKFLTGRHSLKTTKSSLPAFKLKDKKNLSGIQNLKTSKKKSRKFSLPSWKANITAPPSTLAGRSFSMKSQRKSESSLQSTVCNLQSTLELKFGTLLSDANKTIKSPQKAVMKSEDTVKSTSKNAPVTPLKTLGVSPLRSGESLRSMRSFRKSSSPKKPSLVSTPFPKSLRLVHSEKRPKSGLLKSAVNTKEFKRLSLILNRVDKSEKLLNKELNKNLTNGELNNPRKNEIVSDLISPEKLKKTSKKCLIKEVVNTSQHNVKKIQRASTNKKGLAIGKIETPSADEINVQISSKLNFATNSKQRQTPQSKVKSTTNTPVKKISQKLESSTGKLKSSSQKTFSKNISFGSSSHSRALNSVQDSTSARSLKFSPKRRSAKKKSLLKERTYSAGGVRRELSPSTSSAETAAKKLKISCPKKPDKNKKAALLVLGKATRKQLVSQNLKVLLKQKILKKAIKQSTTANLQKSDGSKIASAIKSQSDKDLQETLSKSKMKDKKKQVSSKEKMPTNSIKSAEVFSQSKNKVESTSKSENVEENFLSDLKVNEASPQSPSKLKDSNNEGSEKSTFRQYNEAESPRSTLLKTLAEERIKSYENYKKTAENFFFNCNRRCSKRLSSKNDTGRPDFIELSPTALGLIPKRLEIFKTPKQSKRRSFNLVTPKTVQSTGIIKSASTSKISNRKSVRFSSKDISFNSEFFSPNLSEKTFFDFGIYQTPDVSVNAFISPLGDKNDASKSSLSESSKVTFSPEDNSKTSLPEIYRSSSEPRKCVRKLQQSLQTNQKESPRSMRSSARKSLASIKNQYQSASSATKDSQKNLSNVELHVKVLTTPKTQKNAKNKARCIKRVHRSMRTPKGIQNSKNSTNVKGFQKLLITPNVQKSPRNDLSDLRGVKKLLRTPKLQKSPRNDLSDLRGVKKLLRTPKVQKSPKNDLSDLRGVKRLLRTPKVQKSPRNDLSDLRGVKRLLGTPKVQKSPRNDLSDLRGVKRLLRTPKVQKSPRNDLSDLRGVKKLLRTPKVQKSPKNDLSDLRGVKKLLRTPKVQKSPTNDLSDLRGVKKLLRTPKVQKSPTNDLSDLRGVKKLLRTPKVQKSPKNDLSDLRGVKRLLQTPKVQKSPKNDLSDLRGVKRLLQTPKMQKSPTNDLSELRGIKKALKTLKVQKILNSDITDVAGIEELQEHLDLKGVQQLLGSVKIDLGASKGTKRKSSRDPVEENLVGSSKLKKLSRSSTKNAKELSKSLRSRRGEVGDLVNVIQVKQLLVAESSENVSKSKKALSLRSHDFRAIRGRRTIYSSPKDLENNLSDETGVGELFSRHKPINDYNISLTGIAQLFDLPETEISSMARAKRSLKKSVGKVEKDSRALQSEKTTLDEVGAKSEPLRKETLTEEIPKKSLRSKTPKAEIKIEMKSTERKPTARKASARAKTRRSVKSPAVVTRSQRIAKDDRKREKTSERLKAKAVPKESGETKISRKRKAVVLDTAPSPPKLRRKQAENKNSASNLKTKTVKKTAFKSKTAASTGKMTRKSIEKALTEVKAKVSKVQRKTVNSTFQFETNSKRNPKVQNKRSQSSSKKSLSDREEKVSPVKTRRARREGVTQKLLKAQNAVVEKKAPNGTSGRKKVLSTVKKSTMEMKGNFVKNP